MRQRLIVCACIAAAIFAFGTCENPQVIELLRSPTELAFLDVIAYADDFALIGGATLEPSLRPGVFHYTVYIAKDANNFAIDAGIGAAGSMEVYNVQEQRTGTAFDFVGDEPRVITITVQREYMEKAEYRLVVERADIVPVAENIEISADPPIGAFFIGRGVLPQITVKADLPAAGGELTYQWYMNTVDISVGGYPISGATGDSYTMRIGETMAVRTVYYYAEITNTIDGKTGVTVSPPQAVTFINKYDLDEKSLAMVDVPGVTTSIVSTWHVTINPNGIKWSYDRWITDGFSMGQYPVTWELWKTVFDYADAGGYRFSRSGNQGADDNTRSYSEPIGNKMHPVTHISWRDAVVWLNAYSEMDGLQPVYRDLEGNVLRNSRYPVDQLVDNDAGKMAQYNGYRLPTKEEWEYAGRGANPQPGSNTGDPWTWDLPGTGDQMEMYRYSWGMHLLALDTSGWRRTGEVGSLLPTRLWNGSEYVDGLYDMMGMVFQWVWYPDDYDEGQFDTVTWGLGADFISGYETYPVGSAGRLFATDASDYTNVAFGLRVVRNGGN
jgi:formylglycine-generating enzyme required for sulfatase activity